MAQMGKEDFRVLIKHYFLRQKTISQTRRSLMKYYGNTAPSLAMIHKWYGVFRSGRSSTAESPRTGRPVEVSSPGMIDKIQRLIDQNQYMTVRQIAQATGISTGAVVSITHRHLNLRKLYDDRWIPRDNLCRHAPKKETKLQIKKEPPYVKEEPDYEEQHVITIEKLEDVEVLDEEIFEIEEMVEEMVEESDEL